MAAAADRARHWHRGDRLPLSPHQHGRGCGAGDYQRVVEAWPRLGRTSHCGNAMGRGECD
jgi:hypothetical protein